MDPTVRKTVLQIRNGQTKSIEDIVVREVPFTIVLNGIEIATLAASPHEPETLAVGFLRSIGIVRSRNEVSAVRFSEDSFCALVEIEGLSVEDLDGLGSQIKESGCGGGSSIQIRDRAAVLKPVPPGPTVEAGDLLRLYQMFQDQSMLFKATGGLHSAAIGRGGVLEITAEDIARHNAVDRVFGKALLDDIPLEGTILLTSGRVSKELVLKTARQGIPIILSRSAPMDLAVDTAEKLNVTVAGFVRGRRMNVYSAIKRISS